MTGEPSPPTPAFKELLGAGVLDPERIVMPVRERCRCGHVLRAHGGSGGHCEARRCPCTGFVQNPAYWYELGPHQKALQVPMKAHQHADGSITLERT